VGDKSLERRRSRASFTKTLEKICTRLDRESSVQLNWTDRYFHKDHSSSVQSVALWVAGSYARGAPDCGDLDLILEFKLEHGRMPEGRRVGIALFNSLPDVRIYAGTPEKNESGIEFNEAKLVWQGLGFDWKRAIASIPQNDDVSRFARPSHRVPFRVEQLSANVEQLDEIVELEASRLIRWDFTPLSALAPSEQPDGDEELNLARLIGYGGLKAKKLLPYLVAYFRQYEGWPKPLLRSKFESTNFRIGGASVLIGRPTIPVHQLDVLTTSEIILVPYPTARGPNGIWRIRRGENHPLAIAAAHLRSCYCLVDDEEEPNIFHMLSPTDLMGPSPHSFATTLDLFFSRRKASAYAKTLQKDGVGKFRVIEMNGLPLLDLLSHLDLVSMEDGDEIALTPLGKITIGVDKLTTTDEVIALLSA